MSEKTVVVALGHKALGATRVDKSIVDIRVYVDLF